jgi:exodeoxyribonuclease VII small subunit
VLLANPALTLGQPTGSIRRVSARTRSDALPVAGSGDRGPDGESDASQEAVSFEASLDNLESIVDRLEEGDLPLEAALAAFEEGVALTRRCAEKLEAAERRIEVLVQENANWVTRPFEDSEETE